MRTHVKTTQMFSQRHKELEINMMKKADKSNTDKKANNKNWVSLKKTE